MTYGQLKLRFVQLYPGVSLDIVEGFIADVYADILRELPWQRLNVTGVLQTAAPYATGTVAVTAGSQTVVVTDGSWDASMSVRAFRVVGDDAYYAFTFVDPITGLLDRPYEGNTATAAGYSIFQSVYLLPADCRMLQDNAFSQFTQGPLLRMDRSELNQWDPARAQTGLPTNWTSYMDEYSDPPLMQVELYPVPDAVYGLPFTYAAEAVALDGTAATVLPWVQPSALIEGVTGKIKAHLKDIPGAQLAMVAFKAAIKVMRQGEAQGMAPAQMQLDSYYTSHRSKRWNR